MQAKQGVNDGGYKMCGLCAQIHRAWADSGVKRKPNRCWVNTGGVVKILRSSHTVSVFKVPCYQGINREFILGISDIFIKHYGFKRFFINYI